MKKIKHITYFLKWWFNNYKQNTDLLTEWLKFTFFSFVGGCLLLKISIKVAISMLIIAVISLIALVIFLFIIKPIKDAYTRYKRDQENIFNQLKR